MDDQERIRVCAECNKEWLFKQGEENFLREKFGDGFIEPKRCYPCRKAKREQQVPRGDNQDELKRRRSRSGVGNS